MRVLTPDEVVSVLARASWEAAQAHPGSSALQAAEAMHRWLASVDLSIADLSGESDLSRISPLGAE